MAKAKKAGTKRKKSRKRKRKPTKVGLKTTLALVVVTLLGIALAVSLPYLKHHSSGHGGSVPDLALATGGFGIDVSHYQGEIVWDSLVVLIGKDGRTTLDLTRAKHVQRVEFAYIKATEGQTKIDEMFTRNWECAGASPVRRGAYHFFRTSKDPVKQAENFIRTVGPLTADDLPPALDIETMHRGCSKKQLNAAVKIWLETVEEYYKRRPVIYANDSYIRDILSTELTSRYPIWVAHYKTDSPKAKDWEIWQFAEDATVKGVEGDVDLNCSRNF